MQAGFHDRPPGVLAQVKGQHSFIQYFAKRKARQITKRIVRTNVPLSTPLVLVLISQTFFFLFIFYLKITCLPFYGFRDTLLTHYEFPLHISSLRLFSPCESTKIPSAGTLLSFLLLWPEHNTCDHTFLVSDTFLTGTVL